MNPPFRAEHIGSFLRPREVLQRKNVDEHIVRVVRWQEALGLQVVTDGEYRREFFTNSRTRRDISAIVCRNAGAGCGPRGTKTGPRATRAG